MKTIQVTYFTKNFGNAKKFETASKINVSDRTVEFLVNNSAKNCRLFDIETRRGYAEFLEGFLAYSEFFKDRTFVDKSITKIEIVD